jgi:serine/threonine-protein kinase
MEPAPQTATARALATAATGLVLALVVGAGIAARRNLRAGRGDRRGAARLAWFAFALSMAGWLGGGRHYGRADDEVGRLFEACADALFQGGLLWMLYIAIEPAIRRHWPDGLIGWTRAVAGRWRDPLVGRDILFGACGGAGLGLGFTIAHEIPRWTGGALEGPVMASTFGLLGTPQLLALLGQATVIGVNNALFFTLAFALLRAVIRRTWLVVPIVMLALGVLIGRETISGRSLLLEVPVTLGIIGLGLFVLLRFGVLAAATTFFVNAALQQAPATLDVTAWYAGASALLVGGVVLVALGGFVLARGGEPLFGRLGEAA